MARSLTVGLLYPGEMGAAVARLLNARGHRVVSTLDGRSERTRRLASEAGIESLKSLSDVARASDIVISLVATASAGEIADAYCSVAHVAPASAIYVDANSIGPELTEALAGKVAAAGRDFVDAAINGLAKNLATSATLFLSGPRATEIAALFGDSMRVKLLGDAIGRASTMKMLLGGMSKGLCALFVELAIMARQRDMLQQMIEACGSIYPGMMTVIDRMLPTYAQHSGRRADEMRELEATIRNTELRPCLIEAVRLLHETLADVRFDAVDGANVNSLIERAIAAGLLAVPSEV